MNGQGTQPDISDGIIDFIVLWSKKAEIKALRLVDWIGITSQVLPLGNTLWESQ